VGSRYDSVQAAPDALCSNPVYGLLTPKQVRHTIEDQLLANQMPQLQL
jgi:hypothetical protein